MIVKTTTLLGDEHEKEGIFYYGDIFSSDKTIYSEKRAEKVGKINQEENKDSYAGVEGFKGCYPCHPEKFQGKPIPMHSPGELGDCTICTENFARFMNLHQLHFLWDKDINVREKERHRFKLRDIRIEDLYFLLASAAETGRDRITRARFVDPMYMIFLINLGKQLAGQSMPHFHAHSGFLLDLQRNRNDSEWKENRRIYNDEIRGKGLELYRDENVTAYVPWVAKGPYQVNLQFNNKYEIAKMSEDDIKLFANVGAAILRYYCTTLNIQNVNLAARNSSVGREYEPVTMQFIPRTGTPAGLETGHNIWVVDKLPKKARDELKEGLDLEKLVRDAKEIDPYAKMRTA